MLFRVDPFLHFRSKISKRVLALADQAQALFFFMVQAFDLGDIVTIRDLRTAISNSFDNSSHQKPGQGWVYGTLGSATECPPKFSQPVET